MKGFETKNINVPIIPKMKLKVSMEDARLGCVGCGQDQILQLYLFD